MFPFSSEVRTTPWVAYTWLVAASWREYGRYSSIRILCPYGAFKSYVLIPKPGSGQPRLCKRYIGEKNLTNGFWLCFASTLMPDFVACGYYHASYSTADPLASLYFHILGIVRFLPSFYAVLVIHVLDLYSQN